MDFILRLPIVQNRFNALWIIIDKLTKIVHFLLIKDANHVGQLGKLYVREIVRLYEMSKTMVSNRDIWFVLAFWRSLHRQTQIWYLA